MKAMSKQQLANAAGVTVRTLMRWCYQYQDELEELGMRPNAKLLNPKVIKFLIEKFCIDV